MAFASSFIPDSFVSAGPVSAQCSPTRRVAVQRAAPTMTLLSNLAKRASDDTAKLVEMAASDKIKRAIATAAMGLVLFASSTTQLPQDAFAASSGGRVGGSSFRSNSPPASGGGGGGGGVYYSAPAPVMPFYSPFSFYAPVPVFVGGGGGGGLFALVGLVGVISLGASLLSRAVAGAEPEGLDATVSVSTVKVGLLASAREIQDRLDRLAQSADTSTEIGLKYILQETTLALMRNPEFIMYGSAETTVTTLGEAEGEFSSRTMAIRANIKEETLSNVDSRRVDLERELKGEEALGQAPAEYIVVSIVVANDGKLDLPRRMNSPEDVSAACKALTGIPTPELQALEVIWSPQAKGTTLSEAELLLDHPELRRL